MTIAHKDVVATDNHHPYRWIFNNATDRLSLTLIDDSELYKRALQLDNEKEYTLISTSPIRWKEYGTTNSIPTTVVARLNPSPITNVIPGLSIDSLYSCVLLTSDEPITLVSTPNLRAATNNAQEITLVNTGNYPITFQSEANLTGSQIANEFTLSTTNRVAKLIFIKGIDQWFKYI